MRPDIGACYQKSPGIVSGNENEDVPLSNTPALPRSKEARIRVGIWSENELAIFFSYKSPLPSPQMVEGRIMYDLQIPVASALTISRSTGRWGLVSGILENESNSGVLEVAGVGFKSV